MLVAALNSQFWWWVARSSGIVAWALVTASILWGLTLSTRLIRRRGIPARLLDLHRYLGTLSVVFTAIHLIGLWADSYVTFGPRELFVPFASSWRTRAVAWGIVAFYLLAAVEITSWLMKRLPRRLWHVIHLSSIGLFAMATVHAVLAGSDRMNLVLQWALLTGAVLIVFLLVFRLAAPARSARTTGAEARAAATGTTPTARPAREPVPTLPVDTVPPAEAPAPSIDARLAALASRGRAAGRR